MDDRTIQRKLNQLRKIANELSEEAYRRWPDSKSCGLFYEAEGSFHLMKSDSDSGAIERQNGIRFSSSGICYMGCGAW